MPGMGEVYKRFVIRWLAKKIAAAAFLHNAAAASSEYPVIYRLLRVELAPGFYRLLPP